MTIWGQAPITLNLWDMKRFYERYSQCSPKLRQAVAVLPWGHNLVLINKVKEDNHTEFYANEVVAKGWSRDLLLNAIKLDTYTLAQKQIKSNNFDITLPEAHAEYANEEKWCQAPLLQFCSIG